ncbi:aromatic ring-hydroxylating oxygenase subunit alpha [Pseudaminobacter sp. NGMCC 1.201702]|uniref:aromatic ring-hydroxylating oxygenase subunit alpha n=1 Tax=Pseudaminobacter sp. NGMCC 1.201702 TaxID=3391825 RepID=UPI0039F02505
MNVHWLKDYRPGYGLPREFYTSDEIFEAEQEKIFRNNWFFAGHSVELPRTGHYATLNVGGAPVVMVRDSAGKLHAHHNVCRHRGSIICTEEKGKATRLVCPYHSWAYAHDGALIGAPMMGENFDKSAHGLKHVHVEEFDGLIFVNLSDKPSPFSELRDHLSPILKSQGMARARIALIRDYHLDVNWKIVVENNRECYHCQVNHHGYVSVQYDTENDNPDLADEIARRLADCSIRWDKAGLDVTRVNTSSNNTAEWFRANRTPVRKGMVTESPDGQLVCKVLMAGFTDPDMGTARANTNINFWCHANSDYAHTVRITPVSPSKTIVRGYWLVDENAVEGQDYDPEKLAAFHDKVMSEDWEICRRQWIGVTSPGFEPGPYSPLKEQNVDRYVRWYVRQMSA